MEKHYDRPDERVVCRLTDTLFAIGCADKTCAELAEELRGIYAEMPRECVASVGLMRRVAFTQSIGCACTGEVRGKTGMRCTSSVKSGWPQPKRRAAIRSAPGNPHG